MKRVVVFGNGPVAREVYLGLTYDSPYEVAAFTVDREYIKEDTLFGLPVLPFENIESKYPPDDYKIFIAVGYVKMNRLRAERYHQAKARGYQLISYISSKADIWKGLVIGDNCYIGPYSVIGPSVKTGNNVIVGPGSTVGHDVVIEDHCFIGTRAVVLGYVTVEPYCFIGPNATIRNKITIARECVIGAGAVILEDTREREVYIARSAERLPITSDKLSLG